MIKRKLIPIIVIIIGIILQTTFFYNIKLANVVPNILIIITVSYGYIRGRSSGLWVGFLCGLLIDLTSGNLIGLFAFIFMTIGMLCGFSRKIYFTNNSWMPFLIVGVGDLIYGIYYFIIGFLVRSKFDFSYAFFKVILPEMLYTMAVSVIIFKLIEFIDNKFVVVDEEA